MASRVFLFNTTRKELLFWDTSAIYEDTKWENLHSWAPGWTATNEIIISVREAQNQPTTSIFAYGDGFAKSVTAHYNGYLDLCSFDVSWRDHYGLSDKKHYHVNDFAMLPDPKLRSS